MPRWSAPERRNRTRLDNDTLELTRWVEQRCTRCPRWRPVGSFKHGRICDECRRDDVAKHARAWRRRKGLKGYARPRDEAGRFL